MRILFLMIVIFAGNFPSNSHTIKKIITPEWQIQIEKGNMIVATEIAAKDKYLRIVANFSFTVKVLVKFACL